MNNASTPPVRRAAKAAQRTVPVPLPAGATDCHVHVFDPDRFPFAGDAAYRPIAAECGTAADLAATLDAAGIKRVVLVNPTSGYGYDNRCMLDAIETLGDRARGIARVALSITADEIDALVHRGVVGVRIDFVAAGLTPLADPAFATLLAQLAERDLIVDVQAEADQWVAIAPALYRVPVRTIIDHLGRPRPEEGVNAPGFMAVIRLAETGRVAVKLSGPMRSSRADAPFADLDPFVHQLLHAFTPRHLMWGTDWPFLRSERRIDYGPQLAYLARLVSDPEDRRTILCDTPARWFGFNQQRP